MCNETVFLTADFLKQVPDIKDEETYGNGSTASMVAWTPPRCVSKGSAVTSSRRPISALSSQVGSSESTMGSAHFGGWSKPALA